MSVIKFIRELQSDGNVIALMGNHEDMLVDFVEYGYETWFLNGSDDTILSYNGNKDTFQNDIEWMKKLPLYYEDDNFVYVHAGIDVSVPMNKQKRNTLLWIREQFIYNENKFNKRIVFGHTPTLFLNNGDMPLYTKAGNICIDTGCVYGGRLTALIIEDGIEKEFYSIKKENANDGYHYYC